MSGLVMGEGSYAAPDIRVLVYGSEEGVTVGKYCSIAHHVTLHCGGAHRTSLVSTWPFDCKFLSKPNENSRTYKHQKRTTIGHDVWIADGATVCAGVTIGNGAVIGPGAVVFADVEPYSVVRGNPAKRVRFRHRSWVIAALQRIAWWDWPEDTIRARIDVLYSAPEEFARQYDPGC